MIARAEKDGNYIETYDSKGKRIKRAYNNGNRCTTLDFSKSFSEISKNETNNSNFNIIFIVLLQQ